MQELQAISTNTPVKNKIITVVAEVPYRLPGNVIRHFTIEFKVLKKANHYVAFPICDDAKCRLTHLPHNLIFSIKDGHGSYRFSRTSGSGGRYYAKGGHNKIKKLIRYFKKLG